MTSIQGQTANLSGSEFENEVAKRLQNVGLEYQTQVKFTNIYGSNMAKQSVVTVEVLEKIALEMANGHSLVKIVKDHDWCPSYRQIIRVVQKDPELYEIYRRGRVMQADYNSAHNSE